ncbi:tumor necrosis factor receptor superfamily member 18, partial [Carlito syrichta]|uniref:Tumor necrosis factor receptor superfamily member 18 n=1 Tax=Carlito syrichta TaxID=1868482 RepID=A0A3Q0DQY7_CARSF
MPTEKGYPACDCVCVQPEFHCGDPQCQSCSHHPCPPGQQVRPQGQFKFGFECVDCATGTFSSGRDGHCKPWTDCTQSGFLTVFPGNKTHNALCIPELPRPEPHGQPAGILLTMAACILVLSAAHLGLHIWQLRRQSLWPPPAHPSLLLEMPPPTEDTCSCQFPEEERGEGSVLRAPPREAGGSGPSPESSIPQALPADSARKLLAGPAGVKAVILRWGRALTLGPGEIPRQRGSGPESSWLPLLRQWLITSLNTGEPLVLARYLVTLVCLSWWPVLSGPM